MPKYTTQQVAQIVNGAFGNLPAATRADLVAIVFAESGGNTDAKNTANKNGTVDWGLFQINDVNWTDESPAQRLDPVTNTRKARVVYDRQGIRAWSAYKNGAYRKHLADATAAVNGSGASAGGGSFGSDSGSGSDKTGVPGALNPNPLSGIAGAVQTALDPGAAIRSGFGSIGTTLANLANSYALWLVAVLLFTLGVVVILRKPAMAVAGPGKILKVAGAQRAAVGAAKVAKAKEAAKVGADVVALRRAADAKSSAKGGAGE